MRKTIKFGLNLPDRNDRFNIKDFNENMEKMDSTLKGIIEEAMQNGTDISSNIVSSFSNASGSIQNGDTMSIAFGKIKRLFDIVGIGLPTPYPNICNAINNIISGKADKSKMFYPDHPSGTAYVGDSFGKNLNNIAVSGFYQCDNSTLNSPYYVSGGSGTSGRCFVMHIQDSEGNQNAFQIAIELDNYLGRRMYRQKLNGVWETSFHNGHLSEFTSTGLSNCVGSITVVKRDGICDLRISGTTGTWAANTEIELLNALPTNFSPAKYFTKAVFATKSRPCVLSVNGTRITVKVATAITTAEEFYISETYMINSGMF